MNNDHHVIRYLYNLFLVSSYNFYLGKGEKKMITEMTKKVFGCKKSNIFFDQKSFKMKLNFILSTDSTMNRTVSV